MPRRQTTMSVSADLPTVADDDANADRVEAQPHPKSDVNRSVSIEDPTDWEEEESVHAFDPDSDHYAASATLSAPVRLSASERPRAVSGERGIRHSRHSMKRLQSREAMRALQNSSFLARDSAHIYQQLDDFKYQMNELREAQVITNRG